MNDAQVFVSRTHAMLFDEALPRKSRRFSAEVLPVELADTIHFDIRPGGVADTMHFKVRSDGLAHPMHFDIRPGGIVHSMNQFGPGRSLQASEC